MDQQGKKFTDTLTLAVKGLDHFDLLGPAIGQLGSRHAGYGVKDEHYDVVKRALLGALGSNLGDSFAGGTEEAWSLTYDALAEIMKKGSGRRVGQDSGNRSLIATRRTRRYLIRADPLRARQI